MSKKTTPRRASRRTAPRGSASLTIQHERWAADRWKVILRVNGVSFAIGTECDSREGAERLRTDFGTVLTALGVKLWQWPNAPREGRAVARTLHADVGRPNQEEA